MKHDLHSLTRALSRALAMANAPMSDHDLIHLLLSGLPSDFDAVVTVIQLSVPLPSLNVVTATLSDFERRIRHT